MPHFIVIPSNEPPPESRVFQIKINTLGYLETDVIARESLHAMVPDIHSVDRNEWRVFTEAHARKFVDALTQEFPGHTFTIQEEEDDLQLPDGSVPQS